MEEQMSNDHGWRAARPLALTLSLLLALAFGALTGPAVPSRAQTALPPLGNWTQDQTSVSPGGRDNAAMAYDATNKLVVLFGGLDASQRVLNDTWTWDGITATWRQGNPGVRPPARCCAAMAFDPSHGRIVLFGGSSADSRMLGDTWTWDGRTWTQASPPSSPPARDGAGMAYDDASGTVLLFGGLGANEQLNDTWSWDGNTWRQLSPAASPSPRSSAAMVSDPDTHSVLLFGGCCDLGPNALPGTYLGDTWTWDGTNWTEQQPMTSPAPRSSATIAYDPILGSILLFGGCGTGTGACRLNDTWLWDSISGNWSQQQPLTSPPGRANAAMAADGASRTILLFGGLETAADGSDSYGADTWTWVPKLPAAQP
jgi:hypothetical protein